MFESKTIIPLKVSKWIKIPFLVDLHEMKDLLESLPPFKIYDVQRVTTKDEGIYSSDDFLEKYSSYIAHLKNGHVPPLTEFRSIFSSAWSVSQEAIFSFATQDGRRLLKACEPCVQTQINQIRYSEEDKEFRSQVFSTDSICWGIQVGFPHLYLDPKTFEAGKTKHFPNMALFLAFQRWIRKQTTPTPFVVKGKRINSPIRLGKGCFSWIASHPQLNAFGIEIDHS